MNCPRTYYQQHKQQWLVQHREWEKAHKHPCPTCGILIGRLAKHCPKHKPHPCGMKSSNWKGGRIIDSGGYVLIMNPSHPKANPDGYVREHVLTWEQAYGKPLPAGWVIHHLNGIKSDNRPSNLAALPSMKHNLVLAAKAKRIQELEALLNNQAQLL